jgi:hypothetical protein
MAFRDNELRTPEPEVEMTAYDQVPLLLVDIDDDSGPAAGWTVLHRGADSAAYLLAYGWGRHLLAPAAPNLAGYPNNTRAEGPVGR